MSEPGASTPFDRLRATTPARIGLGRVGDALPLPAQLALQEDHARARDAVHGSVDFAAIAASFAPIPTIEIASRAVDRSAYLRRPDLGRRVRAEDLPRLEAMRGDYDLVLVVADGLSASAVNAHAVATAQAILRETEGYRIGPTVLVHQGRVAIADEIGDRLGARVVAVLIGERPGLTISDSLGIYITAAPRIGRADSERNCISNINRHGLAPDAAAGQCALLLSMARQLGRTGIDLKLDRSAGADRPSGAAI